MFVRNGKTGLAHLSERLRTASWRSKVLFLVAVLIGVASLGAIAYTHVQSSQLANKQWQDIHTRGVLRVGIDAGWYPFSFYTETGWQGIDADIAAEIAKRMDLKVQSIPVGYDSMYDALQLWRVDLAISALSVDTSRLIDYAYTFPYFDAGSRLVIRKNSTLVSTPDLANTKLATLLGSDADRLARYYERRIPNVQLISVNSVDEAFMELQSGRADATLVEALVGLKFLAKTDGYAALSPNQIPYAIALRRDNPVLLAELNRVMADMTRDGTLDDIIKRWVDH